MNKKISKIILENFKIYLNNRTFDTLNKEIIFIEGKNATGKTSILEALSFLSNNSNGLLDNNNSNLINFNNQNQKATIFIIFDSQDEIKIDIIGNRKYFYFNDKKITHSEIAKINKVLYLTPALQYDFINTSGKRKVYDNFVNEIKFNHSTLLLDYQKLAKDRLNILLNSYNDRVLFALEMKIAEISEQIANNRKDVFKYIQDHKESRFTFKLSGDIESCEIIEKKDIAEKLFNNRQKDKISERTNYSIHRFNFDITMNNTEYHLLSNSQQKLCLIQMYKLFAEVIYKKIEIKPIFLIDEVEATFDNNSLQDIFFGLDSYFNQIFVTGVGNSKELINNSTLLDNHKNGILYIKIIQS